MREVYFHKVYGRGVRVSTRREEGSVVIERTLDRGRRGDSYI